MESTANSKRKTGNSDESSVSKRLHFEAGSECPPTKSASRGQDASRRQDETELLAHKHADMKVVCSPSRYAMVVQKLTDDHKRAISKAGFDGMLHMKPTFLRRVMLVNLARRNNITTECFSIADKEIPITTSDVYHIMGLPVEGRTIDLRNAPEVNMQLFQSYKSKKAGESQITLKSLEASICSSKVPDDDFVRQFVLYTIGIILAPTTKDYVDSKYLTLVEKVEDIQTFNWGEYTLRHLKGSLLNFIQRAQANLQGNLALLQFWYWEHVQSYRRHGVSYSSKPCPLMSRWDENTAKLRANAYDADNIDGGVVVMTLSDSNAPNTAFNNEPSHQMHRESYQPHNGEQDVQTEDHPMSNQQVNMIIQAVTKNRIDMERTILQVESRLYDKILSLQEDIAGYGMPGLQNRVTTIERRVQDIRKELKEEASLRNEDPARVPEDVEGTTPSDVFGKIQQDKEKLTEHLSFDDDYTLTPIDEVAVQFIKKSHGPAIVADINNSLLTVDKLKQNCCSGWLFGDIIDAYVSISGLETDYAAVVTTYISKMLLGRNGVFDPKNKSWAAQLGKRCVMSDRVFVPFNAHSKHWTLLVLNTRRKEIQILNSLACAPMFRDEELENTLVKSIQACINYAVDIGQVTTSASFDITTWVKQIYNDIPQQEDSHSCGLFVIKYMLTWNGFRMSETFTQAQIDIFSKKIVSRLLHSENNRIRRASYAEHIAKAEHEAKKLKDKKDQDNNLADDVVCLSTSTDAKKGSKGNISSKKHGRPDKTGQKN
ncbi:hypothetical protein ACP4OV_029180 [Aristida adscensionis]